MRSSTPVPLLFYRKSSKSDVQLKIFLTNVTKSFVENPVKYLFSGGSNFEIFAAALETSSPRGRGCNFRVSMNSRGVTLVKAVPENVPLCCDLRG